MTIEQAIEILEKEKAYMLNHGGDRQVIALSMAIEALEPYKDAISRQEVHRQINKWVASGESDKSLLSLHNRIDTLSPVTPQPKMGRWIFVDKAKEHARCSECGYGSIDLVDGRLHNYCENCGCKMQEVEE